MRPRVFVPLVLALAAGCSATSPSLRAEAPPAKAALGDKELPDSAGSGAGVVEQRLVKSAWLGVEVPDDKDLEPAVKKAAEVARRLDGYVSNQTETSAVLRVPSARLDEAMTEVAALGAVVERRVSADDVTAGYVDLKIRIENLEKVRARLQQLVEQSQAVSDILAVEKELARVTEQLESLKGQLRLMENQTAYATLSVGFQEKVTPGPVGWVFYGAFRAVKWLFVWD